MDNFDPLDLSATSYSSLVNGDSLEYLSLDLPVYVASYPSTHNSAVESVNSLPLNEDYANDSYGSYCVVA
ncbi:hypothetical protein VKT23_019813 [Stygiomarasmius scandens]|uniref:Pheromone n=1 Tax=Marasmiellus scandens TaxID=2682957 RepID=A0ABR1IPH6_9AGAR